MLVSNTKRRVEKKELGINRGKFFDAKLTAEYFDGMNSSVMKYNNDASDAHMAFAAFKDEPSFQGRTATATKAFIHGAVGNMLTEISEVKDTMVKHQNHIMESFETMVDSSRSARIEFDTLEKINADFKGYYRAFVNHAKDVEGLVNGLNSEFGSYAYFEQPDRRSAETGFETICGGESEGAGHFRRCQDKLVEFDEAMKSYLKGDDIVDRTISMDNRLQDAASIRGGFTPEQFVMQEMEPEHVLYDGEEVLGLGAGVAAGLAAGAIAAQKALEGQDADVIATSMSGLFKAKQKQKQESLGTDPFDDKGMYGGNQNGFNGGEVKKFLWFNYVDGEDKELFKYVRKHPEYRHYSDKQIHELFEEIDDHGCTYVAAANSIFNEYKGREKEFEETFGFPMIGENGDLNFNMLVLDFYLETRNKVYLDEPEALQLYTDCKKSYYTYEDMEYFKKYRDTPVESGGSFLGDPLIMKPSFYEHVQEEFEEDKKNGETVVEFSERPSWFDSGVPNRLSHYCHEKGIEVNVENKGDYMSNDDIQAAIDQGKTVVFGAHDYEKEYEDGSYQGSNMFGHEMTITGITPDGRYIVSSCGEKEYYDPEKNRGCASTFYVIDYDN